MPNTIHANQIPTPVDLTAALRPFTFLTAAIGDYRSSGRHLAFALIGGFLWIANLCMNYAFDFYESKKKYGYTWVAVQTIHLIAYLVYTFYTTQRTIPWLKEGLEETQHNIMYRGIVNRVVRFTKRLPYLLLIFGLVCASIEYSIFRVDKAVHVDMGLSMSTTETNAMHALRFINSFHVYLAYGIFWNVPVCVMLLTGYSMKCYSDKMGARLRSSELPSFKESVQTYSERAKFVKKSSSVCMVSLTLLLFTSVTRLGLNTYIFLFKSRLYLHIWHALLPLALMVYPLCTAAWITKQYHWFIIVVVRAWVERGDESDDEEDFEESDSLDQTKREIAEICEPGQHKPNSVLNMLGPDKSLLKNPEPENRSSGVFTVLKRTKSQPPAIADNANEKTHKRVTLNRVLSGRKSKKENAAVELSSLVSAVKVFNKMRKITKRKFNFDKFLSYLESLRPIVGFSIGGVIVTWDLVSTILFLIFSIVAVLLQESIFGSRKSTIT